MAEKENAVVYKSKETTLTINGTRMFNWHSIRVKFQADRSKQEDPTADGKHLWSVHPGAWGVAEIEFSQRGTPDLAAIDKLVGQNPFPLLVADKSGTAAVCSMSDCQVMEHPGMERGSEASRHRVTIGGIVSFGEGGIE